MEKHNLGPLLVFIGIFGGGSLWCILCGLRFDYLVQTVYHGDPGEAIWALDPTFTILAALPGISLIIVGLAFSLFLFQINRINADSEEIQSLRVSNLFYLGEITLVFTAIICLIGYFGISTLAIEITWISAYIMLIITITYVTHLLSIIHKIIEGTPLHTFQFSTLSKITIILLCVEFITLASALLIFQLYIWSFIRFTTIFIIFSGVCGVFLLSFKIIRN